MHLGWVVIFAPPAGGGSSPRCSWTPSPRSFPGQQQTFAAYLHTVDLVDRRIEMLERQIAEVAGQVPGASW